MSAAPSLSTALVHYLGPDDDGAAAWLRLPRSDRRRLAMQAARDQDAGALWSLVAAWLCSSAQGGAVAAGTLKNYRTGLRCLLEAWRHEDLLHPDPDAAATYVRLLQRRGLMPGTVANRLAAARGLYAALRWARAVLLDPFQDVHAPHDPTPPWEKRLPYDDDAIAVLLHVAAPDDRVLVLLGAHAGLRTGECVALRWEEVSRGRRELRVRKGTPAWRGGADPSAAGGARLRRHRRRDRDSGRERWRGTERLTSGGSSRRDAFRRSVAGLASPQLYPIHCPSVAPSRFASAQPLQRLV